MVDDESTQDLISWTSSGDQFTVFNNVDFSRTVLPRYFKHCNWSSFVRQLNMYDFHKINENNNSDANMDSNNPQHWDFKHPWFNKTGFDRLHKIRRKPPRNRLIPQIRYSNAMEIAVPSKSPEYDPILPLPPPPRSPDSVASKSTTSTIQDTILQLQASTENLEEKLNYAIKEVKDLKTTIENQQQLLSDLIISVEYLKTSQGKYA
ncbi:MAG: HSF-type DNA-binding-domain-containing protein [Benjaminiella poitrasii]|nr:MAG: HSF-type DNA-binding-domain-containing protein [Benjaminiella poitrasii]